MKNLEGHHYIANSHRVLLAEMFFQNPGRRGEVNRDWKMESAHLVQGQEVMWSCGEPQRRGATSAATPAEVHETGTRGECSHWGCGGDPNRGEDECSSHPQSDVEEELEPPLPLRDDNDCFQHSPFLLPLHYMHNWNLHHAVDVGYDWGRGGGWYNLNPARGHPPQSCHFSPPRLQNWKNHENCCNRLQCDGSCLRGGVTVNVPEVSVPPVDPVSQVSVLNLSSAAETSVTQLHQRRRTISLPEECRNVFITYSSDVSSEMVTFADFLTKQGFRPAIDLFDNPIRRMDISKWRDTFLKDQSTPIIIAISPKYKVDTEGSAVDSHGLQTKYINSMIQNEFIQQGCLNFRFIPVLFLGTSQKHVPSWLQNTHVYRWPQDTEDLLLRLLREERYVPPPVPVELSLVIRPVTMSASTTLR